MSGTKLNYIHTRLEIVSVGTMYLVINETNNILEAKTPLLVLDNERVGKETAIKLDQEDYEVLSKFFVGNHGKKLDKIDIESLQVLCCREIPELEDEHMFVTVEESIPLESSKEEEEIQYTITLTEKGNGGKYHSIKLNKDVYIALTKYCRRGK